jgi:hypothetical protein
MSIWYSLHPRISLTMNNKKNIMIDNIKMMLIDSL